MKRSILISALALLLVGCSDDGNGKDPDGGNGKTDGGNGQDAKLTPFGGVTSGNINGVLNVFVIDANTNAPVVSADVQVEVKGGTALTGKTGENGLVTFKDLSGPQTVSATAKYYSAVTWIGVNGKDVTLPLAPNAAPSAQSAYAEGTIEGWEGMSSSDSSKKLLAQVGYTWLDDFENPANSIRPPSGDSIFCSQGQACAWRLNTRLGKQAHYATIVETTETSSTTWGFALARGFDMTTGGSSKGEVLKAIPTTEMSVEFQAAPTGIDNLFAQPVVNLGEEGAMVLPFLTK
ncbi:MAG: hypothetical protein V2A73_04900, partial [Pseudomonadota bacterium]